ncbi:MAG: metallophosphoesterase [Alphaproteobacteria bacterium]|nr:metallophosphoesterase [Alphaproteobacteria bacterium]
MRRGGARRTGVALVLLLLALLAGTFVYGLREAVSPPLRREARLALPGWPRGTPPLRVALLSDIHLGNRAMTPARLHAIVASVNAAHPDIVLLAGDFVAGRRSDGATAKAAALSAPLSRLRAPLGIVAVLGNHDYWTDPGAVRAALAKAGVTVLANQAVARGPLALLGVDDAFSGHDDVPATLASHVRGVPVVLSHSPDVVHKLGAGFPLVLAGHTHCGQVVLPWYGPVTTRAPLAGWKPLYDPRYRCGLVQSDGRRVVVTAGLGSGTTPIRLGAPPDWWLLTLGPRR